MSYNLKGLTMVQRALFSAAVLLVERTITTCVADMRLHRSWLRRCGARVFYGFDDVNTYLFPLLYAARSLGMFTLGHQHGAYAKRHAGYTLPGLPARSFVWFDRVLVWGSYWRDKMIRDAPVHPTERWIIGSNKLKRALAPPKERPDGSPPSNILIPYEFLADTASVGRFIEKFLECGYTVWFRPRPDEPVDPQLDSYLLPLKSRDKIRLAQGPLSNDLLATIDIVAGTVSTMLYELLPAGKIVWHLDTPHRQLLDLAEEGFAHRIRLEDIRLPGEMPAESTTRATVVTKDFFGTDTLDETLRENLRGLLAMHETQSTN